MVRRYWVTISIAALLLAACSGSGGDPPDATTTTSTSATTTPATTATTASTTSQPTTTSEQTTTGAPGSTSSSTSVPTTTTPFDPPVAEAEGWRLVITQPSAGTTIGKQPLLCYEATGTSREAILALDVRLIEATSAAVALEARVDMSVGRGGVEVDLSPAGPGTYDLMIGLEVDGRLPAGLILEIPGLTIADGTPIAGCG